MSTVAKKPRASANDENLQSVIDSIPGFIISFDKNLHVKAGSSNLKDLFGHAFDPVKVAASEVHPLESILREFKKSKETRLTKEVLLPTKDGDAWFLLSIYRPTLDANNLVVVGIPINELMSTRVELVVQMSKLMKASKLASLGEVVAGVAHEINNPIAILYGYVTEIKQMLKKGGAEAQEEIMTRLEKQAKTIFRIKKIVSSLRLLSREAERDPMVECDLAPIIEDTLGLVEQRLKENGITLQADPIPEVKFCGRATQLSQVLLNLLNNAFDALQETATKNKTIRVTYKVLPRCFQIELHDNGPGIPEAVIEKIFSPFFTTKPVGQGTGLGLSISKTIVEEHKGKIWCESKPGDTRFIVELPKS